MEGFNEAEYTEMADFLKAIAHPIRLCILKNILLHQLAGEQIARVDSIQSCLKIPQSTLSQHLQKLRLAGILVGHRHGIEITYEIKNAQIMNTLQYMLTKEKQEDLK